MSKSKSGAGASVSATKQIAGFLVPPRGLGDPEIQRFIELAITGANPEFPGGKARPRTIVKSISAKQRPRRPRRDIS
jgi:hypothetical protein